MVHICGEVFCRRFGLASLVSIQEKQPSIMTTKNMPRYCQISPAEAKSPPVENQRYHCHVQASKSLPRGTSGRACHYQTTEFWIQGVRSQESLPFSFTVPATPLLAWHCQDACPRVPPVPAGPQEPGPTALPTQQLSPQQQRMYSPTWLLLRSEGGAGNIGGRSTTLQGILLRRGLCRASGRKSSFSMRDTSAAPGDLGNLRVLQCIHPKSPS